MIWNIPINFWTSIGTMCWLPKLREGGKTICSRPGITQLKVTQLKINQVCQKWGQRISFAAFKITYTLHIPRCLSHALSSEGYKTVMVVWNLFFVSLYFALLCPFKIHALQVFPDRPHWQAPFWSCAAPAVSPGWSHLLFMCSVIHARSFVIPMSFGGRSF